MTGEQFHDLLLFLELNPELGKRLAHPGDGDRLKTADMPLPVVGRLTTRPVIIDDGHRAIRELDGPLRLGLPIRETVPMRRPEHPLQVGVGHIQNTHQTGKCRVDTWFEFHNSLLKEIPFKEEKMPAQNDAHNHRQIRGRKR